MEQFVLTCTSTADMSTEYFETRNIPYTCFHYSMDSEVYPDDLGKTMPFDEFYKRIEQGARPVTSQPNVEDFINLFEPFVKQGKNVLHVSLSSGLSGEINSAHLAQSELLLKYPDCQIAVVDSLGASSGYGLLVDALADKRDEGLSLTEAYSWAETHKLKVHHWFFSTDLTSYWRGGRISKTSMTFGNVLGICPLLNMDALGHLVPREKIRGKKKVIKVIVDRMAEHAEGKLEYSGKCFISNSACMEDARAVAALVEERFPHLNGKVLINSVGTVIGSHTGPGTVALFFFGDQRT